MALLELNESIGIFSLVLRPQYLVDVVTRRLDDASDVDPFQLWGLALCDHVHRVRALVFMVGLLLRYPWCFCAVHLACNHESKIFVRFHVLKFSA